MKYIIIDEVGIRTNVKKNEVSFLHTGDYLMIDNEYYRISSIATDISKKEVRFYITKA